MGVGEHAGLGGLAVGLLSGIALIAIVILSQSGSFQATSTWANYNSTLFPAVIPVALESFFGLLVAATFAEIGASRARHRQKQDRIKARQSAKIRQLAEAAKLTGLHTLDELASALGIPRSTAWTIRNGGHKASGLSVSIIDRMLSAPKLPPSVRTTLLEYIAEKTSGLYGGNERQRRLFCARLKDRK